MTGVVAADTVANRRFAIDRALTICPKPAQRLDQAAGTLSGGERKMLAIGRALLAEPTEGGLTPRRFWRIVGSFRRGLRMWRLRRGRACGTRKPS
jgi:ABC-type uncharacterized transport system YnjBCD ATPase subunit